MVLCGSEASKSTVSWAYSRHYWARVRCKSGKLDLFCHDFGYKLNACTSRIKLDVHVSKRLHAPTCYLFIILSKGEPWDVPTTFPLLRVLNSILDPQQKAHATSKYQKVPRISPTTMTLWV